MTDEIKVEKDVPVPLVDKGRPPKYPWGQLEPGDSFFIRGGTPSILSGRKKKIERRYGIRLTIRTVDGGVRVWRVDGL